jgi:uncharacterized protein
MPLAGAEWAILLVAVLLGYTVFGFGGFGANIVALPLLAQVMPLRLAVPLLLLMDLLFALRIGLKDRQQVQGSEIRRLAPTMLIGMALGAWALSRVAEAWLVGLLGTFVTAYALWSLLGRAATQPLSPRWAWPAGLGGGVFSALYGTGGPIYTIYLARRIEGAASLRATVGTVVLGSALIRLLLFTGVGLFAQGQLPWLALAALPCAALGFALGSWLQGRLAPQRVRRIIWLMLLASGVSLLARSLLL